MNLDNIKHSDFPFEHWEIKQCLDKNAIDEISILKFLMVTELMMALEQPITLEMELMEN